MRERFYSNGKLFITGEYVVLDGANAFALPTKTGQDLVVEIGNNGEIAWKSYDSDGSIWFEDTISFEAIIRKMKSDSDIKNTLIEILQEAHLLNHRLLESSQGFSVTTHLTFPRNWGLGTSSTLINNIAEWFKIDPFVLLKNSFGGSGYDIACARNDSAILYHLENGNPITERVAFHPSFLKNLFFVYLNQKQNSKSAIASYREKTKNPENLVDQINAITQTVLNTSDLKIFKNALEQHEAIMSEVLDLQTVKQRLFPDFNGTVKSLGAWGGDFVLVVADENPHDYFTEKGYPIVIPYSDMIL